MSSSGYNAGPRKGKTDKSKEDLARQTSFAVSKLIINGHRDKPRSSSSKGYPNVPWIRNTDEDRDQDISASFNNLRISGAPNFPVPELPNAPGPLPTPPRMEMPRPQHPEMSRTMRHALNLPLEPYIPMPNPHESNIPPSLRPGHELPPRPSSDPGQFPASPTAPPGRSRPAPVTPHKSNPVATPSTVPSKTTRIDTSESATPTKDRRRVRSDPATPTSGNGTSVQCSGTTQQGVRCKNRVKSQVPLARMNEQVGAEIERYCNTHMKQIKKSSGFYLNSAFVDFSKFIPSYLQENTQTALRTDMTKPISDSDEDGYIYTFEIIDNPKNKEYVQLKVGRATHLNKRISEWSRQCSSKEQILRGWWPGNVEDPKKRVMTGTVEPGVRGKFCHRLERLIQLELADVAQNAPYLQAGFPNVKTETKDPPSKDAPKKCDDCGALHREIFTFKRFQKGKNKDKEWELIVQPVLKKWGEFMELYEAE